MGLMAEVCLAMMLLASVFIPVCELTTNSQERVFWSSEGFEAHRLARAVVERYSSGGAGALLGTATFAGGVYTLEDPHLADPLLQGLLPRQELTWYGSRVTLEVDVGGVRGLARLTCSVEVTSAPERHASVVMLVHDDL